MTALQILTKAIYTVQSHLVEALQISGLLWIGLLALEIILGGVAAPVGAGAVSPVMVLTLLAKVVVGIWIAVAWHRFLLLGDRPGGILPGWNGPAIFKYLGVSLVVGLALMGVSFIVVTLVMALPFSMAPDGQMTGAFVLSEIIAALMLNLVFYRLSPVFPAAALGQSMKLRDAWVMTRPVAAGCFWLALLSAFALSLFTVIMAGLSGTAPVLGLIVELVAGWVLLMLSVSILTTIYAAVTEGSPGQ